MLVFEHSPLAKLPRQWYIKPSEDLKTIIFDGDYGARGYEIYEEKDGEILRSINRTDKHRVDRIVSSLQMVVVMWDKNGAARAKHLKEHYNSQTTIIY